MIPPFAPDQVSQGSQGFPEPTPPKTPQERIADYLASIGRQADLPVAYGLLDFASTIRGDDEGALPIALVCWLLLAGDVPRFIVDRVLLELSRVPLGDLQGAMVGILDNSVLWIHAGPIEKNLRLPDFVAVPAASQDPITTLIFAVGAAMRRLGGPGA